MSSPLWRADGIHNKMKLQVAPCHHQRHVKLCFTLIYNGHDPIKMYKSDLPWGAGRQFVLAPEITDSKERKLEILGYIYDPLADTMLLEPHRKYTGAIDLGSIYKNIETVHQQSDILFKWSYTLRDWNGAKLSEVNGTTLIPSTGKSLD